MLLRILCKQLLLISCCTISMLVASEMKKVGDIKEYLRESALGIPIRSFCQNPGKHKAKIMQKNGYTVTVEGPFFMPKEKKDIWTIFITTSQDEKIFSNNFTKAIHAVQWEASQQPKDTLRVIFCDENFCFLRMD